MTQNLTWQEALPLVATVIIARNEAKLIERCLASVLQATARFTACDVVLVDSHSTDRTVTIARSFPVRVIVLNDTTPLCPALGRLVGERHTRSKYVFFVDGDTEIETAWLSEALEVLEAQPAVAGVGGKLREIYYQGEQVVGANPDCFQTGNHPEPVYQLGGNALYRRAALDAVGSFNPYVTSYEEAELAERLRQAGYIVLRLPTLLGTHRTGLPGSLGELRRRFRDNLMRGYGQVLRLSMRDKLFWRHARHMQRYLQFTAMLLMGVVCGVLSLVSADARFMGLWVIVCGALIGLFMIRSRSMTKPFCLILDWSFWTLPLILGFLRPPRDPRTFSLDGVIAIADQDNHKVKGLPPVSEK